MRIALFVVVILGCSTPQRMTRREPVWPVVASYTSTMVEVRTTLGRALIGVEVKGIDRELRTSPCDDPGSTLHACAHCELADAADVSDLAMLEAVKTAADRYPTSVLDASKIQHVALCRKLYEEPNEMLAGTVDLDNHRLFLSLDQFLGKRYDPQRSTTVEDIFHHELYHLLEFELMRDVIADDVVWRAQNLAGFEYKKPADGAPRPFGFVNTYATTNDYEDRASVFQMLMARPDEVCALAQDDPILRAKIRLLWERVAIVVGDEFLRRRASCVSWVEPARPLPTAERPASLPTLPWIHTDHDGEHRWLAPPVRPQSLR